MTAMSPWVRRNIFNAQTPFPRGSQFAGATEIEAECQQYAESHYSSIYLANVGAEEWDDDATALASYNKENPICTHTDAWREGFCGQCLDEHLS
jgi:hypothetical protein